MYTLRPVCDKVDLMRRLQMTLISTGKNLRHKGNFEKIWFYNSKLLEFFKETTSKTIWVVDTHSFGFFLSNQENNVWEVTPKVNLTKGFDNITCGCTTTISLAKFSQPSHSQSKLLKFTSAFFFSTARVSSCFNQTKNIKCVNKIHKYILPNGLLVVV